MRQSCADALAGKRTTSGQEPSAQVSRRIPEDGTGAVEKLRERNTYIEGTGGSSGTALTGGEIGGAQR